MYRRGVGARFTQAAGRGPGDWAGFGSGTGSAVVEAVLVVPAFMLVVLVAIQFALWAHAAHIVESAAARGDQASQAFGGDPSAGSAAARSFLNQSAGGLVVGASVSSQTIAGGQAVVTVSGRAESILPFFSLPVDATSIGPVQEFRVSG